MNRVELLSNTLALAQALDHYPPDGEEKAAAFLTSMLADTEVGRDRHGSFTAAAWTDALRFAAKAHHDFEAMEETVTPERAHRWHDFYAAVALAWLED